MTSDEALAFLQAHRPMPDDDSLSDELIAQYDDVRRFFLEHPDSRCIEPLLNSFGTGSGFGVYQLVEDTLARFPKDLVVPHLARALESPFPGVRYWTIQMVPGFFDPMLMGLLVDNLYHPDANVRSSAADALSLVGDRSILGELERAGSQESNAWVKRAIDEAIQALLRGSA